MGATNEDESNLMFWILCDIAITFLAYSFFIWLTNRKDWDEEAREWHRRQLASEAAILKEERRKDPIDRKRVIANTITKKIMSKKIIREDAIEIHFHNEILALSAEESGLDEEEPIVENLESQNHQACSTTATSSIEIEDDLDDSNLSCSICLECFEPGDCLSWSKGLRCRHVFHGECLTPWLMTNTDCPMCRTIIIEESDFEGDDSAIDNKDVQSIEVVDGRIALVTDTVTNTATDIATDIATATATATHSDQKLFGGEEDNTEEDADSSNPSEIVDTFDMKDQGHHHDVQNSSKSRRKKRRKGYMALSENEPDGYQPGQTEVDIEVC